MRTRSDADCYTKARESLDHAKKKKLKHLRESTNLLPNLNVVFDLLGNRGIVEPRGSLECMEALHCCRF
jgi:hypothetical protein